MPKVTSASISLKPSSFRFIPKHVESLNDSHIILSLRLTYFLRCIGSNFCLMIEKWTCIVRAQSSIRLSWAFIEALRSVLTLLLESRTQLKLPSTDDCLIWSDLPHIFFGLIDISISHICQIDISSLLFPLFPWRELIGTSLKWENENKIADFTSKTTG